MSADNDPPEFVGADHSTRADPVPSRKSKLVQPVQPEPEVKKPGSHPKHAIERPRREYEAAQQDTRDAHAELTLSKQALADAERAESAALAHWLELQPKVDPEQLLRDYANRAAEQRRANVKAGLPPEGVRQPTHNRSPVDIAAANRQRPSPQMATVPLRSPTARRVV